MRIALTTCERRLQMSDAKTRPPIGHHIIMNLWDKRVIARSDPARRTVSRCILTVAREHELLAFGQGDNHLHGLNAEDWDRCGKLAQKIEMSIKKSLKLPVGFAPVYRKPIYEQDHLYNTFYYDLRQQDRHGVTIDLLHEASNLPDLLGLRVFGRYTKEKQQEHAPRVVTAELYEILGVSGLNPNADVPCADLAEAAASAACLPKLGSRKREAIDAKAAAIQAAAGRLNDAHLAQQLGLKPRRVGELRERWPVDPELVKAIRLQLVLRHIKQAKRQAA